MEDEEGLGEERQKTQVQRRHLGHPRHSGRSEDLPLQGRDLNSEDGGECCGQVWVEELVV